MNSRRGISRAAAGSLLCVISAAVTMSAGGVTQKTSTSPLSRLVPIHVTLKLPVEPCTVPNVTAHIAKLVDAPAGVEYLPEACVRNRPPAVEEVPLIGKSFEDVLDLLVKADPRYYWTETDGVVLLRPLAAWTDPRHFLHSTIAGLDLEDANIGAAMDAILPGPFGHGLGAQIMATDVSQLTLATGPLSVVEALDAVVRTHGRARWEVSYCLPEMKAEVATVWIKTYDDRGIGRRAGFNRNADGKLIDRCRPK